MWRQWLSHVSNLELTALLIQGLIKQARGQKDKQVKGAFLFEMCPNELTNVDFFSIIPAPFTHSLSLSIILSLSADQGLRRFFLPFPLFDYLSVFHHHDKSV